MSGAAAVAAVDLGASSGRVVVGRVGRDTLDLTAVARFPNGPVVREDGLHWDLPRLTADALDGLRRATAPGGPAVDGLAAVGVDAWAVDYGLLRDGRLLDLPWCYRDARTAAGVAAVHERVAPEELYRRTGLQFLLFNTVYQLAAETRLAEADGLLLVPDLVTRALSGEAVCERTNASTTGLLDVRTGDWDDDLLALVGLDRRRLGRLVDPGTVVGDHDGVPVVAVGSHDTASAVVAVPMTEPGSAYVSCGTWGLVGVELERPVLTEAARAANFTNEGGVDGRTRFLTNVMGTWLLSETLRAWGTDGLTGLLTAAASLPTPTEVVDVQDPRFAPPNESGPGAMPERLAAWCTEHDVVVPEDRPALVRLVVESLAHAFAVAVEQAADLSGQEVRRVHVVGGGAQNDLLCARLADRLGRPVLAGPVEATSLGNVLVQARAVGAVTGSLEALRDLVARTQSVREHRPGARMGA